MQLEIIQIALGWRGRKIPRPSLYSPTAIAPLSEVSNWIRSKQRDTVRHSERDAAIVLATAFYLFIF